MKPKSKNPHTPGPWFVDGSFHEGNYRIISDSGAPSGVPVAEVVYRDDARLIAAAPEMLALLKEIEYSPVGSAKSGLEFKIRQLIAKAEGRP